MINVDLTPIFIKDLDTKVEYTTYIIIIKPEWKSDPFWRDVEVNRTVWKFFELNNLDIKRFECRYEVKHNIMKGEPK